MYIEMNVKHNYDKDNRKLGLIYDSTTHKLWNGFYAYSTITLSHLNNSKFPQQRSRRVLMEKNSFNNPDDWEHILDNTEMLLGNFPHMNIKEIQCKKITKQQIFDFLDKCKLTKNDIKYEKSSVFGLGMEMNRKCHK